VTHHEETPLLVASISPDSVPRYRESYRRSDGAFDIDTVRVLVQQAKNDPMQIDCYGSTSISISAGNKSKILSWLLDQDEFEIDLTTQSGHTSAAFLSGRGDFPDLLGSLVRHGVSVTNPCAKAWFSYLLPTVRLGGNLPPPRSLPEAY
jgi:hypothetical protein